MRTIKSQDGKMIVNAEKLLSTIQNKVNTHKGYSVFVIRVSWWRCDFLELAEYSTEKRALRVLDMLNNWLNMYFPQKPENPDWEEWHEQCLEKYPCFFMPPDGEELDA